MDAWCFLFRYSPFTSFDPQCDGNSAMLGKKR